jgi:hypothetical protein
MDPEGTQNYQFPTKKSWFKAIRVTYRFYLLVPVSWEGWVALLGVIALVWADIRLGYLYASLSGYGVVLTIASHAIIIFLAGWLIASRITNNK